MRHARLADGNLERHRDIVRKLIDTASLFLHQNEVNKQIFLFSMAESPLRLDFSTVLRMKTAKIT